MSQTKTPDTHPGSYAYAQIDWDENGQPMSSTFGDIYFSKVSGLHESRYVFIEQNRLPERFTQQNQEAVFTIGETGFGSGLNFLCAWHCFIHHAPASARLHFVSVEKFPLTHKDFARALALWPELERFTEQLIAQYPGAVPGFHRCCFDSGRVKLTLIIDSVDNAIGQIDGKVDAWFLDGFAPSKNPQMWQPKLFRQMAVKSAPGATYSTFTAARMVRDGLKGAGMSVHKVPGFGCKRDMLCGEVYPTTPPSAKPWLMPVAAPPNNKKRRGDWCRYCRCSHGAITGRTGLAGYRYRSA